MSESIRELPVAEAPLFKQTGYPVRKEIL